MKLQFTSTALAGALCVLFASTPLFITAQTNLFPATGKVGIGTITPTKTLEVVGETRMHGYVEIQNNATITKDFDAQGDVTFSKLAPPTTTNFLGIGPNGRVVSVGKLPTTAYWELGGNTELGGLTLGSKGPHEIGFITNNTQRMSINSTGLVTIGSGSLYNKVLDVVGTASVGNLQVGPAPLPAGYRLSVSGKVICEEVEVLNNAVWPDYVFADNYELLPLPALKNYVSEHHHLPGIPSASETEQGVQLAEMNRLLLEKVEELSLHVIGLNERITELENTTNK